jgi:peptidoglycan hydrolase CwlO-like protein
MDSLLLTLIVNAVVTPLLVIVTNLFNNSANSAKRRDARDDNFIRSLEKRLSDLEREIKEVRIELKNRDEEYLALYKEHTTLRAKYDVLQADHEELKQKYENTVAFLAKVGHTFDEKYIDENLKT